MRSFQPPAETRFYAGVDLHARSLFLSILDRDGPDIPGCKGGAEASAARDVHEIPRWNRRRRTLVSTRSDSVKAYLVVTGLLFGLLAFAHLLLTILEWPRLADPWFVLQGPGIGVAAATLCFWAWRLLRASARP